jgi:hypothetical protein
MMPLWTTATVGRVRMGIALGRRAMRRPARVADADRHAPSSGSLQRVHEPARLEIFQLAFGAAAL